MKKPRNTLTGAAIITKAVAAAECAKQQVNDNPETELTEQTDAAASSETLESSEAESLIDDYSPSANWNVEEYAPPGMYNLSFYPCKILS